MREVTNLMINEFKIRELGRDFMGFSIQKDQKLEFHHMIVPKRLCTRLPDNGYVYWNGAILCRDSHTLIHTTELYDREIYLLITKELVEQNLKGKLDIDNQKRIYEWVREFIKRRRGLTNRKGYPIVSEEVCKKMILTKFL